MFLYQSNVVAVQNHSWGNIDVPQFGPGYLASEGVSQAAQNAGRFPAGRAIKGRVHYFDFNFEFHAFSFSFSA